MSVREPKGDVRIIDIAGELTAFCEPVLTEAYEDADRLDEAIGIYDDEQSALKGS
ncbi:MAG: hypothetical protein LC739_14360 [Actinobacteria bacterium]|nr:hypothetical protein [Actinomycetota bacterium]